MRLTFGLERCSQPIRKIAADLKVSKLSNNNEPNTRPQNSFDDSLSMPSSELDLRFPPDWLDLPLEPTWDIVEGALKAPTVLSAITPGDVLCIWVEIDFSWAVEMRRRQPASKNYEWGVQTE